MKYNIQVSFSALNFTPISIVFIFVVVVEVVLRSVIGEWAVESACNKRRK
jgi:hypothetical protein